jgi:uncharacterized protein YuzB (UPF0349 family)
MFNFNLEKLSPTYCPVCNHSLTVEIDEDLRRGVSVKELSENIDLSENAIRFHARGHKARR